MSIATNETQNKKPYRRKIKKCLQNTCSTKMLKKRLPVIEWLPKYKLEYIIQDFIAGITVGLTAIPQGIAYAVIAGLPPEHGLYASLTSGIVYVLFGSCYNVTVGPTAILAAMTAKYVTDYSPDFAILAAFLAGVFMFLLGVLNLGFLVDFISMPVIKGFTNAAALQIAASQLKSYFALQGPSGNYFAQSMSNFIANIQTAKLWDPILATSTIIMLILLNKLGDGCKRTDGIIKKTRWFISLSRNAIVVIVGMLIAFAMKVLYDAEPLVLIGDIGQGLPKFGLPPFSTVVSNQTLNFMEMVQILGIQLLTYLTDTFYYIPKASLAGLIITALFSMIDYKIIGSFWKNSKKDFILLLGTMNMCLLFGLEYGIITGILKEAFILLYYVARPPTDVEILKSDKGDVMVVHLAENVPYCAVEHVRRKVMKATNSSVEQMPIVLEGGNLKRLDFTAAFNLVSMIRDLDKNYRIFMLNFNSDVKQLCLNIDSSFQSKFVCASSPMELNDIFVKDV